MGPNLVFRGGVRVHEADPLATGPLVVSSRFDYLGFFWKTTSRFQNTTKTTFLSTIWWFWRWFVINYWLKDELLINSNSSSYHTSQQSRLHSKSVARMSESASSTSIKGPKHRYMKENSVCSISSNFYYSGCWFIILKWIILFIIETHDKASKQNFLSCIYVWVLLRKCC